MLKKSLVVALVAALVSGCGGGQGSEPAAAPGRVSATPRVFEMRTYTAHEGKLEDLKARFRNHTQRVFEKHGMTNIGYWIPQDRPRSENTIVYILAYPSREAARRSWEAFRNDPEWQRIAAESERNGRLVARVESVFLDPADFSPIR